MTASHILSLLKGRHPPPEWVFIPELRNATGYVRGERYIDAWAMNAWPSKGLKAAAYEIKVERSDWMVELGNPAKRQAAMEVSNEFWFVAPKGVVKEAELPEGCGLMLASEKMLRRKVHAPYRKDIEFDKLFVASCLRRMLEQVKSAEACRPIYRLGGDDITEAEAREVLEKVFALKISEIRLQAQLAANQAVSKERGPERKLVNHVARLLGKAWGDVAEPAELDEWVLSHRQPLTPGQVRILEAARGRLDEILRDVAPKDE